MESIFENTTTLTRQNLTEMARATVPRWSLLVGIIPAVLAVATAIWDLARRGSVCGPGFCCWRPLLWL